MSVVFKDRKQLTSNYLVSCFLLSAYCPEAATSRVRNGLSTKYAINITVEVTLHVIGYMIKRLSKVPT